MKNESLNHLDMLINRYPALAGLRPGIATAAELMVACYRAGGMILVCGNGGSAADAEHIVGELMKGFILKRAVSDDVAERINALAGDDAGVLVRGLQQGIPAVSLVSHTSLNTAVGNDNGADLIFAQQVLGYSRKENLLIGMSTSGNARNVALAMKTARALGMKSIGLTGEGGGKLKELSDVLIAVPATGAYKVQEFHMPVYHTLCLMVEEEVFG